MKTFHSPRASVVKPLRRSANTVPLQKHRMFRDSAAAAADKYKHIQAAATNVAELFVEIKPLQAARRNAFCTFLLNSCDYTCSITGAQYVSNPCLTSIFEQKQILFSVFIKEGSIVVNIYEHGASHKNVEVLGGPVHHILQDYICADQNLEPGSVVEDDRRWPFRRNDNRKKNLAIQFL